ncbi:hypothetical protein [Streptomyces osmaniensis]|uniref:Uncharacterized protein n=1 Tax=Streptomyces osmaniensis TaxID=593134 RepID=A0ABP6Z238_9ACTN|nr:hypothetical protein KJK32_45425 [Streptomyces sp. JCM17656]
MAALPRTACPACSRDVAITRRGLTYRHDPASGRDPELKSCPGSLKPVHAPDGELLLFVGLEDGAGVDTEPLEAVALF